MNLSSENDGGLLHVGKPNVGDEDLFRSLVDGIFERRWFTNNGQLVKELEQRLADFLGVRHAILVCNATVGLQLACHALDLTGEVIVPAFTFVATPHAVHWEGLKVVFADVRSEDHLIDPDQIEQLITPETSAIAGVHLWGQPCHVEAIASIANEYGLKVMYDAAHAFACRHGDTMIGNFGDLEVFSFHATKFFNTFEGGAITTNDDALAHKIRLMTNFGFEGVDRVVHLGTNAKMTEVCAAMGLAGIDHINRFIDCNRANHRQYQELLEDLPGVSVLGYDNVEEGSNFQYVVVEIDAAVAGKTRDEVCDALRARNILARRYFHPGCHRMEPYQTLYPEQVDGFPIADTLCSQVMCLPNGTAVSSDDIKHVCSSIVECLR